MRALVLCALLSSPAAAEVYPALHDVSGVAADDVLNIRAEPSASAAIVGTLPPDATGVEVVGVQGGWGRVGGGEGGGWVRLSYLDRQPGADWFTLTAPLRCMGTEPFWSLGVEPVSKVAVFSTPDAGDRFTTLTTVWTGARTAQDGRPTAALALPDGFATLTGIQCSDGMSDRPFGIAVDLYLNGEAPGVLHGCCTLAP